MCATCTFLLTGLFGGGPGINTTMTSSEPFASSTTDLNSSYKLITISNDSRDMFCFNGVKMDFF